MSKQLVAALLLLLCLCVGKAEAHRMNVFAWVTPEALMVESRFAKNSPAQNSKVTVQDTATKEVLAEAKTDTEGKLALALTAALKQDRPQGVTIRVDAGEGHFNECTIEREEMLAAFAKTSAKRAIQGQDIDEAIERHLAPLRKKIAELSEPKVGVREIVGGIGWILGLCAAYVLGRRTRKKEE